MGFPDSSGGKESPCNAGDPGSILGLGRSTGKGIGYSHQYSWASLVAQLVKNRLQCRRPEFDPWVVKISWRRERLATPVFWPGEFLDCLVHGLTKSWTRLNDFHFQIVSYKYKIKDRKIFLCVKRTLRTYCSTNFHT